MATDEQFSSIEYLSINHSCTFNELCTLISYLPELRRLTFLGPNDDDDDSSIEVIQSMELSNLTYLNIDIDKIPFDNLEIFLNKLNGNLKVLSLRCVLEDIIYLDANRWENFILKNLPQLEKFYFIYNTYFGDNEQPSIYLGERDQFNSLFWIQRQWILETQIGFDTVRYLMHPYK
jgi:hypothetical protein